jgi:thiol-disulfide isomerase/thioredoxin
MTLKIFDPYRELLLNSRLLFTVDFCHYCRMYLGVIERINANLPVNKRIELINCSYYHDYGIVTDPRIPIFLKYYEGSYPTLFINGHCLRGANSSEEIVAWLKSRLKEEFIIGEDMYTDSGQGLLPLTFDKKCQFIKKGLWRRKIKCS